MTRWFVVALVALAFVPTPSRAVDIKNIRPCYGPFGAVRTDPSGTIKCLPGDVLFMAYDIEGLKFDPKTGKASYDTKLELLDDKGKAIFANTTKNDVPAPLGGTRMPGDLHVIMGPKRAPGKYAIRLTVHDKIAKEAKQFTYAFEVVPEAFGFVGTSAPALGLPGQSYLTGFALVNMALDAKKQPKAEVTIRILDDKGKAIGDPVVMKLPRDMPENTDLEKANFVPLNYPIYLNRPGRFTIDVTAEDKNGNKKAQMRYPLTVLDVTTVAAP